MTVSDLTLFNSLASSLDQSLGNIQLTQQQLATGKRVNQPSDDPLAFAQAQLLNEQQSAVSNNVPLAQRTQGQLTTMDNALANVADAVNSAISVATQGADGSVNTSQMTVLATQVQSILNQVVGAANLQYAGSYVFGGNQVLTTPFSPAGAYAGDNAGNSVTFSNGTKVQLTYSGQSIFGDNTTGLIGALTSLVIGLGAGNKAAVSAALPQLQTALQTLAVSRGTLGASLNTVTQLVSDSNSEMTTLQSTASSLTGIDLAKAAMQEQETMLQQQALVSVGSSLGKLPLINILA